MGLASTASPPRPPASSGRPASTSTSKSSSAENPRFEPSTAPASITPRVCSVIGTPGPGIVIAGTTPSAATMPAKTAIWVRSRVRFRGAWGAWGAWGASGASVMRGLYRRIREHAPCQRALPGGSARRALASRPGARPMENACSFRNEHAFPGWMRGAGGRDAPAQGPREGPTVPSSSC
ncbi:hypothetical protein ACFPRL_21710 [Pseudoclavibacter helvolus]